jgi:magnesium transporter
MHNMITYYFRTLKDEAIKEITEVRTGIWVHAVNPTEDELHTLEQKFGLDEDILADATDFFEVPRLERDGTTTYFFTRYPFVEAKEGSDTAPLLIAVGESFLLTLSLREVPVFSKLLKGSVEVHTTQKAKLFIQIMELITNAYDTELNRLRKAVHKDRVRLRKIGTKEIEQLVAYETKLNSMVDALVPTNAWLQQVTNGSFMQLYAEDVEMMEDLMIANSQVVNSARSILKTIQNIRSAIEAIMTSRLNNALRILTVLTILLTVPLVVASLYGMNVPLPQQENVMMFWLIVGGNIVLLTGLVYLFRKNEWF